MQVDPSTLPATTLRVAVLGSGRIGQLHAEILTSRISGAEVVAVYDIDEAVAADVARRSRSRTVATAGEAIGADDVDVVAICTPTDTHVELIQVAAAAGKHILCEKPIALNLAEVDRALAAVEAVGVQLQVGLNRRFDPSHRAVAEGVAAGEVGDVHIVKITSRDPAPPPISYIEQSGGLFLDMTIHDFDMARYVTGSDVVTVSATAAVRVNEAIGAAGDVDTAVTVLTHENGAITTIDNSRQAVYGFDQRVEAFGSKGAISSENIRLDSVRRDTVSGSQHTPLQNFFLDRYLDSYVEEWKAFVDAVANGRPVPVTGLDGRACFIVGLAAMESIRQGRRVAVDTIA